MPTATNEDLLKRITVDPDVCNGKPTIRGLRISAQLILDHLSAGDSIDDILANYSELEHDDVRAALAFASDVMGRHYRIKDVA